MKKKLLFTIAIFFFSLIATDQGGNAFAQYKNPFFNTLTVEKGLPEGSVLATLEDKLGYIWLGTLNGLVRYDGYQLKPYTLLNDDGKPIVFSSVQYLFEDSKGRLWLCMSLEGIYCYDRQKDAFDKIKFDTTVLNTFKDEQVYHWVEDKQSGLHILVTFDPIEEKSHVFTFDPLHNKMQSFGTSEKGKHFIPAYNAGSLVKDVNEKIWLTTDTLVSIFNSATASFDPYAVLPDTAKNIMFYGLVADQSNPDIILLNTYKLGNAVTNNSFKRRFYQLNTKTKEFTLYEKNDTNPGAIADGCIHILKDSLKRIWCTTEKGISLLNTHTGTFTNYPLKLPAALTDEKTHVEVIAADKEGNLWLGGYFKGVFYLDVKTGIATYYVHSNAEGSLPDHNGIRNLFFDRSGTLWLNMPGNGITYLNRSRSLFNPFLIAPSLAETGGKISLDDYYIYDKYGDSAFLVKDSASLYIWNYNQNSFQRIDLGKNKIYKQINTLYADKDLRIWIGCGAAGLFCYDPVTKQVKHYKNDPKDSTSLPGNAVSTLIDDAAGNIWVGTPDKGICFLNKQTGKFTRYPFIINNGTIRSDNKLDDRSVQNLYFDSDSILWIGTNLGGLNRLDTKTSRFTSYIDAKSGFRCVISIFEDSHKRLWAGTYLGGLYLVDKTNGSFKRYGIEDGLLYSSVSSITEDKAGKIWAVSTRGLSRLDLTTNRFTNFTTYNSVGGFLGKGEPFNLVVKNGLVLFDPGKIKTSDVAPVVLIESVGYNSVHGNKDTILFTNGRANIELKFNENKISFQYIAIHTADAVANRYAYQLEGNDKDWIQAGTQRSVTYTNLAPGTYTFKIKAANSDGVWNETGASFNFTILPPWWKTWWAYLSYAALIVIAISSFMAYRSAALKRENKLLEDKVALRTTQLQSSIADLKATQTQLIQSEKMASLGELTAGIAHEIQNPLNFVNNFSEVNMELIGEMKSEIEKGNIEEVKAIAGDIESNEEKINHHGKRADAIVKGMLQHSQKSSGQKEPTDINALCDEYVRLSYHGLRAKDKTFNADFKTDFDDTIGKINIIPQDIGRVLLNLYNNAFYAVQQKQKESAQGLPTFQKLATLYQPAVSVSTKKMSDKILIIVKDNANGIPQNIVDKIFQPFFTTKPTGQGTGLGLSLSYDIIKAHGGEIKVETKEGEGSEFIIQLPIL